jgi:hypothetical protein
LVRRFGFGSCGYSPAVREETPEEIEETELDEEDGEILPDREEMSVIDLGEGGGLAPPPPG